jgi:hypothetical protein
MREQIWDLLLLVFTLLYVCFRGGFSSAAWKENFWSGLAPWVCLICSIAVIHVIISVRSLIREVQGETSPIRLPGEPEDSKRKTIPVIPHYQRNIWVIGFISIVLLAIPPSMVLYNARTNATTAKPPNAPPPTTLAPTEIYVECHQMSLPIHIPPKETAHIKALNKNQFGNTKWAMYDIRNDNSKERLWPDQKAVNSVKFNPGVFGYQCDVTNHASTNLIDLAIPLTVNFGGEKTPLMHTVIISPLDAGTTFSFYVINECAVMVSVIGSERATVQVLGEDNRRNVPLHWPHRSPIEEIMLFLPSKVRWTGNVCE